MNNTLNREGFWASSNEPDLPRPAVNAQPWPGQDEFLKRLKVAESRAAEHHYRGFSTCRVCLKHNGSSEFVKGNWVWPSGFAHYVEAHNVRPSLAFQEYILGHKVGDES